MEDLNREYRPLISVIIPCYKVENYLNRCMESVVNQTYDNLEIILVDDGSPDKSGLICDEWALKDKRIKVIHKYNEGLGYARNSGMKLATGDYIAFIDSDDYVEESMYERLVVKALEKNADIVYCGHVKQMSNGNHKNISDFSYEKIFEKDELLELSQGFFKPILEVPQMLTMSVWHAIYKREIIKQPFYSEREVGSEDIHYQVSAVLNANRIVFIPDNLYVYCYNGDSLSHEFNMSKYDRYKVLRDKLNEVYRPYGIESPADYSVFIMAFASIRRIALSKINRNEQRRLIGKIVKDEFWNTVHIDLSQLSVSKKIFYKVIKLKSIFLMKLMADIYCFMNYTVANKELD